MSKIDRFTAIDSAIVMAIGRGSDTFASLCKHPEVMPTAEAMASRQSYGDRVIDGRLQALKKAGAIRYVNRRWEVA